MKPAKADTRDLPHALVRWSLRACSVAAVTAALSGLTLWQAIEGSSASITDASQLEYYYRPSSFSEVRNTTQRLEALCTKFLTDLRYASMTPKSRPDSEEHAVSHRPAPPEHRIKRLRRSVKAFEGTDHQLRVVGELLRNLKNLRRYDEWLDLYLASLYEHPMHIMVGRHAGEAVQLSRKTNRAAQVRKALSLVLDIPRTFPGKDLVKTNLIRQTDVDPAVLKEPKSLEDSL